MKVSSIDSSDAFHLTAAQGWLELGNHIEANAELEEISPLNRAHPDVLELRWQIYRRAGNWEACADLADAMTAKEPEYHRGDVYAAQTLYWQGRYQDAYNRLEPALAKFPEAWVVHYDVGCYACLLGRLEEARTHLEKYFSLDDSKEAKLRALNDPDLKAVW